MAHKKLNYSAIAKAIRAGLDPRKATVRFGISRTLLDGICQNEGVDIVEANRARRVKRDAAIVVALDKGGTAAEVAEKFKVGVGTIWNARRARETKKPSSPLTFAILAELLNTTQRQSAIAHSLGVSRQYVAQITLSAQQAGIKLARPRR